MEEKLDAGNIILQMPVTIYPNDSLHQMINSSNLLEFEKMAAGRGF